MPGARDSKLEILDSRSSKKSDLLAVTRGIQIRRPILTLHLCAGLLACLFLFLLGLTGSLMVFEEEIDRALNPKLTWVKPGTQRVSLAQMKAHVEQDYRGYTLLAFSIPPRKNMAWTAVMLDAKAHTQLGLAFDPYTGNVIGSQADRNNFTDKVHQLHLRLLAGRTGGTIVTWAAIFLLLLSLSGMVLWWPRKIVWINWRRPARLVNWNMHQTLGIYISIVLMIFSLSAIVIHWDDAATKLMDRVAGAAEAPNFPKPQPAPPGAVPLSPDQLLANAGAAAPGARATGVQFAGNLTRISMAYPEDRTPSGRTNVLLDQYTGKIVYLVDSRTASLGFRAVRVWNREIHTGDIGGLSTRILACVVSLMLPVLAVTGPLIWLLPLGKASSAKRW
jgi:uncharacterized iron-regulated membrane protein